MNAWMIYWSLRRGQGGISERMQCSLRQAMLILPLVSRLRAYIVTLVCWYRPFGEMHPAKLDSIEAPPSTKQPSQFRLGFVRCLPSLSILLFLIRYSSLPGSQ